MQALVIAKYNTLGQRGLVPCQLTSGGRTVEMMTMSEQDIHDIRGEIGGIRGDIRTLRVYGM